MNIINKHNFIDINDQIGSDEVGKGDFFGPIVVVAAFVKKEDINTLKKLGVTDSKKLSDRKIIEIYDKIKKLGFSYEKIILSNDKYNKIYEKIKNINTILTFLHNYVLLMLFQKHQETKGIFIDKFSEKYFNHLKKIGNEFKKCFKEFKILSPKKLEKFFFDCNVEKIFCNNIYLETGGENKYPSIALASIIARAIFLEEIKKLKQQYKFDFPLGAVIVNNKAREFLKTHKIEELDKLVKKNFKNYECILENK